MCTCFSAENYCHPLKNTNQKSTGISDGDDIDGNYPYHFESAYWVDNGNGNYPNSELQNLTTTTLSPASNEWCEYIHYMQP